MDFLKKLMSALFSSVIVIMLISSALVFGFYLGYKIGYISIPPYTPREFDDYSTFTSFYLKVNGYTEKMSKKEQEKYIDMLKTTRLKVAHTHTGMSYLTPSPQHPQTLEDGNATDTKAYMYSMCFAAPVYIQNLRFLCGEYKRGWTEK